MDSAISPLWTVPFQIEGRLVSFYYYYYYYYCYYYYYY